MKIELRDKGVKLREAIEEILCMRRMVVATAEKMMSDGPKVQS